MKVALIEDTIQAKILWQASLESEAEVAYFTHPMQFLEWTESNKEKAQEFSLIVCDRLASGYDAIRFDFVKHFLKSVPNFSGKIVVNTASRTKNTAGEAGFAVCLNKKPLPPSKIFSLIAKLEAGLH